MTRCRAQTDGSRIEIDSTVVFPPNDVIAFEPMMSQPIPPSLLFFFAAG